ncbi:DUF134 domain-containing protein [Proteiniphilum acetatigenes]|jgi:predicted DNA-binding protein (UPF0251 family)/DNA-directed RNA polymerase subunit RPC12/RpoP|uniref:DUF134 domain-containing protein n=1 Tax=Proteiniphilum acetatigenes TaxID=294710 RepID=UPI0003AA2A66|nr:DUF134 domain-containing protein [Proteiniphilum acetatigenes]SFK72982.1 Predicted DNA-binding protein, UPF0251 family [Porphyromonadaceae bacterium KH3CP3RA]
MPNRVRYRKIMMPPPMDGYKPFGIPLRQLESVTLLFEEVEAIRLVDYEDLSQEEAAEKMDISRPTFTRLINQARKKVAKAFVEGRAILMQGGNYITEDSWYKCHKCNETMTTLKQARQCRNCDSEDIVQLNKETISRKRRFRR